MSQARATTADDGTHCIEHWALFQLYMCVRAHGVIAFIIIFTALSLSTINYLHSKTIFTLISACSFNPPDLKGKIYSIAMLPCMWWQRCEENFNDRDNCSQRLFKLLSKMAQRWAANTSQLIARHIPSNCSFLGSFFAMMVNIFKKYPTKFYPTMLYYYQIEYIL